MKLSYKILSVFGIDIELHLLFILFILAFILLSPMVALLLILIFFFVTLHELMHSLVAIRNGINVKKIVLLPIGGMAMIENADIKPIIEIKMSLAGPLFNITMVYVCLLIAYIFSLPLGNWLIDFFDPTAAFTLAPGELVLFYSFYANLILGVFNLFLPAFPLDGGRIFRALLALRLDYVRATRIAKNVSLAISAALFVIAFLFGEIWIMIISFFIAFGAVAEFNSMVAQRSLARVRTRNVLSKGFLTVKPGETVSGVLAKMVAKRKTDALLLSKGRIRVLSLSDITKLPLNERKKKAGTMAKQVSYAQAGSTAESIARIMDQEDISIVPVMDGRKFVGVVERADLERLLRIMNAMKKA